MEAPDDLRAAGREARLPKPNGAGFLWQEQGTRHRAEGFDARGASGDETFEVDYPLPRYGYVEEAFRVLRPGGKPYVDNVNLCCDGGWSVFETHRWFSSSERPDHITVCSTPQELQEYLKRAGFEQIECHAGDELISVWGRKPIS